MRLKRHLDVQQLILFGSRARGDHFVTSDYDFVLVSPSFSAEPFTKRAAQLYRFWASNCDLEVLCYAPGEWERLKDRRGILLNAQREGIRVV